MQPIPFLSSVTQCKSRMPQCNKLSIISKRTIDFPDKNKLYKLKTLDFELFAVLFSKSKSVECYYPVDPDVSSNLSAPFN